MKKILTGLIFCALITNLTACGGQSSALPSSSMSGQAGSSSAGSSETADESETAGSSETAEESETAGSTLDNAESSSLLILEQVWQAFPEDKKFPAAGGDMGHSVMGGPGEFSIEDPEALTSLLLFPEEQIGLIDDAASLSHMMNANNFTSALYHLTDSSAQESIASDYKEIVGSNHWLCGFPEGYLVMSVGEEYILTAYGFQENIDNFKQYLTAEFGQAEVLAEGKIS